MADIVLEVSTLVCQDPRRERELLVAFHQGRQRDTFLDRKVSG